MYDDYDLDYTFALDHASELDEYYARDSYDLEEDYARDGQDYESLAYRHYAWYNLDTHIRSIMIAQKRRVRITLDLECYDDLDIETLDWKDLLGLEGDENVYVSIKDLDDMY